MRGFDGTGRVAVWVRALTVSTAIAFAGTYAADAYAQSVSEDVAQARAENKFSIKAQSLGSALAEFGRQSGIQVSAHGDIVRDRQSPGVSGVMSNEAALKELLAGTGLTYKIGGTGAIITQPGGETVEGAQIMGPITIEGRRAGGRENAADRALSLSITNEDLQRRNPGNAKQLFSGESGVSVGGGVPLSQKVYVHGIEENNLNVTVDGARQNNKTFHHAGNNLIDPSLLKAVRIDPGVAPADAGPAALGGAIVYETVDVADLLAPDRMAGGFVTGSYDTDSGTVINGTSAYARARGAEALAFFKWGKGDDYFGGDGSRVVGSGTDIRTFLGKAGYEGFGGHRIELTGEYIRDEAPRPYRANIQDLTNRGEPPERVYDLKRETYAFNYENVEADGLFDPKLTVGYGRSVLRVPDPYGSIGTSSSWSGKLENDFHLSDRNVITAGVDFYSDKAIYDAPASPNPTERARNLGAFAQFRLQPLDQLRLSLGSRADQQWFRGLEGTDQSNRGYSHNASAAYDLGEKVTIKAGVSRVWGGIALAENFIFNTNWNYSTDIEPVSSKNGNLGIEVRHAGFTFDATIYKSSFRNARKPTYGGGPALTKDFKTKGFDIGFGYDWGDGFARISYSNTEIKVDGSLSDSDTTQYLGAPLGRIFAIEANHRFTDYGVTIGGTMDAALKNTDTAKAGGLPQDPYAAFSFYTEYQPVQVPFLTVRFEANNIFDAAYADRATYGQDFSNVKPMLEPGRSFLLMAKAKF